MNWEFDDKIKNGVCTAISNHKKLPEKLVKVILIDEEK